MQLKDSAKAEVLGTRWVDDLVVCGTIDDDLYLEDLLALPDAFSWVRMKRRRDAWYLASTLPRASRLPMSVDG